MTKGKKFIDKKKSVTYRLVPREAGPSQFEDDAQRYTFVPVSKGPNQVANHFDSPSQSAHPEEAVSVERFFPFPAGPKPDWDPDVVAALDDDFNFDDPDNQLDDDFIVQATGIKLKGDDEPSDDEDEDEICGLDDIAEEGSLEYSSEFSEDDDMSTGHPRGKAKSTNYSMTSAVTNCTENIKMLNERFEKMLVSYDDDQIGALDFEDIDGHLPPDCERIEEMMISEMEKEQLYPIEKCEEEIKGQILHYVEHEKPETFVVVTTEKPEVEFDCESILSTYSNIYNHPTVIKADSRKPHRRLTRSLLKQLEKDNLDQDEDNQSVTTASFTRPKDETPEQRRERKKVIKEVRRENRVMKKENKVAFKKEKQLQDTQAICARKNNGIRML